MRKKSHEKRKSLKINVDAMFTFYSIKPKLNIECLQQKGNKFQETPEHLILFCASSENRFNPSLIRHKMASHSNFNISLGRADTMILVIAYMPILLIVSYERISYQIKRFRRKNQPFFTMYLILSFWASAATDHVWSKVTYRILKFKRQKQSF